MMRPSFEQLEYAWLLWLVPALIVLAILTGVSARRAARRFASPELHDRLMPRRLLGRAWARIVLRLAAVALVVLAIMDPRWGTEFEEVEQRGIDVMVVLDVSRSMLAEDVAPNRLERAKAYVEDLVASLAGDRIGLVTFAGRPRLEVPLTVDYSSILTEMSFIEPRSGGAGGSRLGEALAAARDAFTDDDASHKAIVLLTDGEDHGGNARALVNAWAADAAVPVFALGLGDADAGARIPIPSNGRGPTRYVTYEGEQVWSRMDPDLLTDIAVTTGGAFVPIGTGDIDVRRLFERRIAPMTDRSFESARVRRGIARFQWLLVPAVVLLIIERAIPQAGVAPGFEGRRGSRSLPSKEATA